MLAFNSICCFSFTLCALWPAFGLKARGGDVDWLALVQKPYEGLKKPDLGLRPLKTATKPEWDRDREQIKAAWEQRLGKPPTKPNQLDVKIHKTDKLDGCTRQLLSFHSEGGDRISAYLLVPNDLRSDEKRPAIVVFHQTTRDALKEPVGLAKNAELALALHLVQRGYITLSPECYILKDPENERKESADNLSWARGRANILKKRHPDWT